MKAAGFQECGGPEKLQILEVPEPEPGRGEVRVQVAACGLNHFDLFVLEGPAPEGFSFPFWGGADVAGTVSAVGEGVTGFAPGDRVVANPGLWCGRCEHCVAGQESLCHHYGILGDARPGGFAEAVVLPEGNLLPLPTHVPFDEAAAMPLVFQTAWRALMTQARVRAGDDVLILGASGGVASAAVQIARRAGARVFAVTSGSTKGARVRELGADFVLDRRQEGYWGQLAELTGGRGVDVVVENVGAATWSHSLQALAKGGRLVTYGRTTGRMAETDLWLLFWHQLRIVGSTMASRSELAKVMDLLFRGDLQPVMDTVYPLEEARAAYQRLQQGEQFGKIVLQVGGPEQG